jgi:gamma-glutamyltranspeptidase / glutathione hydrolase
MKLPELLAPAIALAENGFPVMEKTVADWIPEVEKLKRTPAAASTYLVDGQAPKPGAIFVQKNLARTLRTLAKGGREAFYRGEIAKAIVDYCQKNGGFLSMEDLGAQKAEWVEPISTTYRGHTLYELPPNGQGLTALVLLNILEQFDIAGLDPSGPERLHLALEAARLAFGVRDAHISDPATMREPVAGLLDKAFAKKLSALIDPGKRVPLPKAPTPGSDTIYLTVVDRDRTAVSLINSLYSAFGTGICTEKTGIMLHNRGTGFVVEPGHPNTIEGGKRPMHTIIPALAMRNGRCEMPFGVMGADYQPMGHTHLITNMVDYGMDVQAAIDHPRMFYEGEKTEIERGVPAATIEGLTARGHTVAFRPAPLGGGQAIVIDWERGVLTGGSDPRKDGCALGY